MQEIAKCQLCRKEPISAISNTTGCVYDGWEEPIYDYIPCEECGGTGLNMEEQAEHRTQNNKEMLCQTTTLGAQRMI